MSDLQTLRKEARKLADRIIFELNVHGKKTEVFGERAYRLHDAIHFNGDTGFIEGERHVMRKDLAEDMLRRNILEIVKSQFRGQENALERAIEAVRSELK